jgi:hypothetical protein
MMTRNAMPLCVEQGDSDDEDVTTNNIHDEAAAVQSVLKNI